ncbi:MAG TPA: hypothetical protein VGP66_10440 [Candidatus Acidoferrum sp.]|jgi:hypothetical protein|nr:hypothetical protein [Candidatus Acidoferrum sp.]
MALSLSKISWGFLVAGILVPCIFESLFYTGMTGMFPIEGMPEWLFIALWPAFGFVMASDTGNGTDSGRAALGFLMSVIANALLYLLVGGLISFIYRRLFLRGDAPISK